MAAIPRELIESELFGHEKGAFTGAHDAQRRPLRAGARRHAVPRRDRRHAAGGADPAAARAAGGRVHRGRRPHADPRPTSASSPRPTATCRQLIRQGLFREDLFYRLNVAPIRLPPLRERSDDIPALVRHFLRWRRARACRCKTSTRRRWSGCALSLAGQRPRAGEPGAPAGGALLAGDDRRRRRSRPNWPRPPPAPARPAERRPARGSRPPSSATSTDYFAAHRGALPAAGLYDRVLREIERPLIVATLGATRGNQIKAAASARAQSQYAAQENPRIGHPRRARPKIAAAAARLAVRRRHGRARRRASRRRFCKDW